MKPGDSHATIFFCSAALNLCHMPWGKCAQNAGKDAMSACDQRKNAAKIDYLQAARKSLLKDDFGFYFRGVTEHPEMCTIFSMALSCRLQH